MDYLKIKQMQHTWYMSFFGWISDNTVLLSAFALCWKGIDKAFKYYSEARDSELRKIVHDEMNPTIQKLTDQMERLTESIFALKNKM